VTKALTPDMEASGLGGLANIVMKNAPDTAILSVDLSTGYNQYLLNHKFSTFDYGVVNIKNPARYMVRIILQAHQISRQQIWC